MLPTFKTSADPLVSSTTLDKRSYEEVDHSDSETRKYTRQKTNVSMTACESILVDLRNNLTTSFSTASGKNLAQVSLVSLEKAKTIIDNECPINFSNNNSKVVFTSPTNSRILKESNTINLPINRLQNSSSKSSKSTKSDILWNNNLIETSAPSIAKSNFKSNSTNNTDESPVMMDSGHKTPLYSMNSHQNHSVDSLAVSDDSLIKARRILDDNTSATSSRNANVSKSSGFSTASGRNLAAVTEESLIKARQTLDDDKSIILTCNNNKIINLGFSIASGRGPSTSEESLNKSHDNVISRNDKNSCFSTAGGRSIADISDESLKKVQRILSDDLSQNSTLQSNVTGSSDSKFTLDNYNSKFKIKESSLMYTRLGLTDRTSKNQRKLRSNISQVQNSLCQNIPSLSRTSEHNFTNKLFDLEPPLKRVGLKDIVSDYPLNFSLSHLQELGISKDIINMSPKNAISYRFTWPSKENVDCLSVWGPNEALSCLIESGANSNLIDERWVYNHYKWIVWKIASMIRSFPHEFHSWWDPKKVLDQLQYRYEREINNTHRSALKLIIERDGTASMPMVLCVSDIIEEKVTPIAGEGNVMYSLELTDMWYKIWADVDQPLQRAISESKIRIGYKLEICGAKIVGDFAGVPALDVSNSTRLKLSANSTKRAHWDSKLGFRPFHPYATLRSLCPDGGHIFAMDIIILRKYPMIFRETMKDGTIINRNEQEEEYANSKHEIWLNNKIQLLINEYEVQHKPKNKYKAKSILGKRSVQDICKVTSGEQLYIMMQDCLEPSKFWQDLSSEQGRWLQNYIQKKEQEKADHMNKWVYDHLEELDYARKVIPFFRVRVCDYHLNTPTISGREAIINIWQPNESLFNTIKEGQRYKVYNVTARNKNYPISSSVPIRLSSMGRSTVWKEAKMNNSDALSYYSSRTITFLNELQKMELNNEVDLVAYILVVGEPFMSGQRFGKPIKVQTLLVTDNSGQLAQIEIKNISYNYMGDMLKYRAYDPKYGIYMLSTCDDTEIKRSSRDEYTRHAKENLENWIKNNYDLVNKCEEIAIKLCKPKFNYSNNVNYDDDY